MLLHDAARTGRGLRGNNASAFAGLDGLQHHPVPRRAPAKGAELDWLHCIGSSQRCAAGCQPRGSPCVGNVCPEAIGGGLKGSSIPVDALDGHLHGVVCAGDVRPRKGRTCGRLGRTRAQGWEHQESGGLHGGARWGGDKPAPRMGAVATGGDCIPPDDEEGDAGSGGVRKPPQSWESTVSAGPDGRSLTPGEAACRPGSGRQPSRRASSWARRCWHW